MKNADIMQILSLKDTNRFAQLVAFSKALVTFRALDGLCQSIPTVISAVVLNGYIVEVVNHSSLRSLSYFIKNSSGFRARLFVDLVCLDFPGFHHRFTLTYLLLSIYFSARIALCSLLNTPWVESSLTSIWGACGWAEREAWDMFGIIFIDNHDLRRLLTDYGFRGHPLRKDFPLSGYFEIAYVTSLSRIVRFPVSLSQEYRNFFFANPWLSSSTASLL